MKAIKVMTLILLLGLAAGFAFAEGGSETSAVAAEGPQYGGTLTWSFWEWREPTNWDVTTGSWTNTSRFLYPMYSFLVIGDTETYGPRGTNEYPFQSHQEIPDQFLKGDLAERWEVKESGLTFYLRKGVMYTGNDRIGMAKRELTADDAVYGLKHILEGPLGKGISAFVKDIYAPDKYTVQVDFNYYEFTWGAMLIYGMGSILYPEEVIKAGGENWRNHSGTGAWIIENYTSGAGATYKRNPDYFGTTTIDGKVYETPFADKLVKPIIPDKLSMVSALRTGKLDVCQVDQQYVETLAQTSPELIVSEYPDGGMEVIHPDCADPPFDNMEVRRAMMIGMDFQSYIDTVLLGKGVNNPFPPPGSPYWTDIKDMPPEDQLLFSNDKTLAKKMLAEQGYPNGFTVKGYFKPSNAMNANCATWTESELRKIGITVELVGLEAAVHEALRFSRDFDGIYFRSDANGATTELPQRKTECASLASSWNNAVFDEMLTRAQKMVDVEARTALLKEAAQLFMHEVGNINMPAKYNYKFWWPWVNNYYGEEELGYGNQQPCIDTTWLDLSLKKKMGF
jgi:peptide/nickel transport system substrate-binding protein